MRFRETLVGTPAAQSLMQKTLPDTRSQDLPFYPAFYLYSTCILPEFLPALDLTFNPAGCELEYFKTLSGISRSTDAILLSRPRHVNVIKWQLMTP